MSKGATEVSKGNECECNQVLGIRDGGNVIDTWYRDQSVKLIVNNVDGMRVCCEGGVNVL